MSINTKAYIENYIKIRDKRGNIIALELNEPQLRYYNVIKKLYLDKNTGKPTKLIIQDINEKTVVYILYNGVKINSSNKDEVLAFKEMETDATLC